MRYDSSCNSIVVLLRTDYSLLTPLYSLLTTNIQFLIPIPQISNLKKHLQTMETKNTVLETLKAAGAPLNAGKIAELSGLDRKEVDKAMKQLKVEGAIVSPVRCKWTVA